MHNDFDLDLSTFKANTNYSNYIKLVINKKTLKLDIFEKFNVLKNYNAWQKNKGTLNKDLADYKLALDLLDAELQEWQLYKDGIDTKTANTFLIKTRSILRDIETVFKDTKERKFDEFITLLQSKSNAFFESINIDSFTGNIIFTKRKLGGEKVIVKIELQEADGKVVHKPNQSLETSMHIIPEPAA